MTAPRLVLPLKDLQAPGPFALAIERLEAGDSTGYDRMVEIRRQYPDDPKGANFLGLLQFNRGDFSEALDLFSIAARIEPGTSAYTFNLAVALLQHGRNRESFDSFLASLNGDEIIVEAHRWAWTALALAGKFKVASMRLKHVLWTDFHTNRPSRPAKPRIELPQVTICAVDCADPALAARALQRSAALCDFGAVKLLTSSPYKCEGITTVPIEPIRSVQAYSHFIAKDLHAHIDTDYVLVIQWDGYVVNAEAWTDEFMQFDYLGAPWPADSLSQWGSNPDHAVGNGGFSLRSRRFLDIGLDEDIQQTHPEDEHLCRTYRPLLEAKHGIRYGDRKIAEQFSYEMVRPQNLPFGFHGIYNMCSFEAEPRWLRFDFLHPGDLD